MYDNYATDNGKVAILNKCLHFNACHLATTYRNITTFAWYPRKALIQGLVSFLYKMGKCKPFVKIIIVKMYETVTNHRKITDCVNDCSNIQIKTQHTQINSQ